MPEWIIASAAAFGAGGVLVAIIGFGKDFWKFKAERKAKKEDRAEEKADEMAEIKGVVYEMKDDLTRLQEEMVQIAEGQESLSEGLRVMLLDRILHLGQSYIAKGEIDFDDRKRLHAMHECYHDGLDGNGDADFIMDGVYALPLKE